MRQRPIIASILFAVAATLHAEVPVANPERILLPLFTPPILGAHGADFRTVLTLENPTDHTIDLFGVRPECEVCLPEEIGDPVVTLEPHTSVLPRYEGTPGKFVIAEKGAFDLLAAHLRVYDASRRGENFGTEIPIVREDEMRTTPIHLPAPLTSGFRNTLRVYGTAATIVRVAIGDQQRDLALTPGADEFAPSYAIFGDFPAPVPGPSTTVRVTVTPLDTTPGAPRVWAFISVTNNTTQLITTITPQR